MRKVGSREVKRLAPKRQRWNENSNPAANFKIVVFFYYIVIL